MKEITPSDIEIIFKGALRMSGIDSVVAEQEAGFLNRLARHVQLPAETLKRIKADPQPDTETLSQQLSSPRAKKAFLLTLATVALADHQLTKEETGMLEDLTRQLGVGRVKINQLEFAACEQMVFKLLADEAGFAADAKKLSHQQLSDFDMI